MTYTTTTFAGGQYESPSCDILDVAVETAFLVDSIGTTIDGYTIDPEEIEL